MHRRTSYYDLQGLQPFRQDSCPSAEDPTRHARLPQYNGPDAKLQQLVTVSFIRAQEGRLFSDSAFLQPEVSRTTSYTLDVLESQRDSNLANIDMDARHTRDPEPDNSDPVDCEPEGAQYAIHHFPVLQTVGAVA
jgi:hypothetical protein